MSTSEESSDDSDGLPPTRQFEAAPTFSKAAAPKPAALPAAKPRPPPSDSEDDSASDEDDDDDDDESEPGAHAHVEEDSLEAGHEGDIVNWAEQVDDAAVEASGRRLAALYSTKVGEEGANAKRATLASLRR